MSFSFVKPGLSRLLKNPYVNALRGVPIPELTGNQAQIEIARLINLETPRLIARVGMTEGRATAFFLKERSPLGDNQKSYPQELVDELKSHSGYFPGTDRSIDEFVRMHLNAIEQIDLQAIWTPYDRMLKPHTARSIGLIDLDPFFTSKKWTLSLAERRVCVASPFVESMKLQYAERQKLFATPILPDLKINFASAPVTNCDADTRGQNWIRNKNKLAEDILSTRPDVAIIGAGAYGLPVAHILKNEGVTAVVMGGTTQLLFALRGRRWENDPQYARIMNEHWKRPKDEEKPLGYQDLEIGGGAYW